MTPEGRRYRVLSALGRGGFGTVFHAEMIGSGGFKKQVALKVLNPEVEGVEEIASRLRDEGRILGRLRHRAIVRVDGLVNFDGRWAVVMEYVEGIDLRAIVEDNLVPLGPALEILAEIAGALFAAHEKATSQAGEPLRLLHRDLKPGNIQITPSGEVKVLDFGIARADFDTRESNTLSLRFGSLPYMSPERLDFMDSHAGDIYALGAMLYEMLTGLPLGKTSANTERHLLLTEGALAVLRDRSFSEPVIALIADCLAYTPEDRPDAREVQRRCQELRREVGDAWLSDWADDLIPRLMARRKLLADSLCGTVLVEESGFNQIDSASLRSGDFSDGKRAPSQETFVIETDPLAALDSAEDIPAPSPPRRGALLGLFAVAALGLSGWWLLSEAPPAAPVIPVEVQPVPVPPPIVAEPPKDTPQAAIEVPEDPPGDLGEDPPPAAPSEDAPPVVIAEPPPTPVPEPVPEPLDAPATGVVMLSGDLSTIGLVSATGERFPPGAVPAGTYTLMAHFPGQDELAFGAVEVVGDGVVKIRCDALFLNCGVQ